MIQTKNSPFYRYFIELQYDGSNYHGWQIQPNAPTIQAELNEKLSILLRSKINLVGAGRTDTGVHARQFYAHFDYKDKLSDTLKDTLCDKLNRFLSNDINIVRIIEVDNKAHARFDALSRTYKYYISLSKDVFDKNYRWHVFCKLDVELMNNGANLISYQSDFTSFSKLHTDVKTNICQVYQAFWEKHQNMLVFTITADRFLRNMVRAIVGTLVELGSSKIDLDQLNHIILSKNRNNAGISAPAKGLFLETISYSYI